MAGSSQYTDYYKMDWDVIVRQVSLTQPKIVRVAILTVATVLIGIASYFLNKSLGFSTYEFFWLVFVIGVLLVVTVGVFWGQMSRLVGQTQVHKYKLSHDGISVDSVLYDFEELNIDKIKKIFEKGGLKIAENSDYYSVSLPKGPIDNLEVFLPNATVAEKFAKNFQHYIEEYED